MNAFRLYLLLSMIGFFGGGYFVQAQPSRSAPLDAPFGVKKLYLQASFGLVRYHFTNELLRGDVAAGSITNTTAFSGRFLLGYHLSPHWDIQFGVLRPAAWVSYEDFNIPLIDRTVWINVWSLSSKYNFKWSERISAFAEAGLSNVAREGFDFEGSSVAPDAQYLYPLFGAGVMYRLNDKFGLSLSTVYIPPNQKENQPTINQLTAGLMFSVGEISEAELEAKASSPYFFPRNTLQLGYTTNSFGFDINRQFSGGLPTSLPIFWLGDVRVAQGWMINYQRTLFRSRKHFSLSWGASVAQYKSTQGDAFYALSAFPVVRWWFWRPAFMDLYFNYSVIGPAFISQSRIDAIDTGTQATFQDFMGIGAWLGDQRQWNIDLRITHYSNGNLFTENAGVAVPLMISLGRSF
ncbi:acyloxyacyl hydrolase [Croceiramulus getboli]|nr:acyloxyacyl hydrolase [Flavobacteriaceae bacterium YJPT1-3]